MKLSLVSIPVKAFTARKTESGDIHLNQLHRQCNNRIRYKKSCPVHGEVSADDIVMGYAIGKDQYVPIEPEEIAAIRRKSDQSIEIDAFIEEGELDDRFLTDRSYYLVPDGKVAQKPYALVRDAMSDQGYVAVAQVVLSSREQLVLVRPLDKLLIMTVLQHAAELKEPTGFEEDVETPAVAAQELQLTKQLVEGYVRSDWNYAQYEDQYQQQLSELVASKIEGKQLVEAPDQQPPVVINLMDALKASLEQMPPSKASTGPGSGRKRAAGKSAAAAPSSKPAANKPPSQESTRKDKVQADSAKPSRIAAESQPRKAAKPKQSRHTG